MTDVTFDADLLFFALGDQSQCKRGIYPGDIKN
jgi:hypothetical protein